MRLMKFAVYLFICAPLLSLGMIQEQLIMSAREQADKDDVIEYNRRELRLQLEELTTLRGTLHHTENSSKAEIVALKATISDQASEYEQQLESLRDQVAERSRRLVRKYKHTYGSLHHNENPCYDHLPQHIQRCHLQSQ